MRSDTRAGHRRGVPCGSWFLEDPSPLPGPCSPPTARSRACRRLDPVMGLFGEWSCLTCEVDLRR